MKLKFKPQPKPGNSRSMTKDPPSPDTFQPKFRPQPGYIRLTFALTHADYHIIREFAAEKGLGEDALSAALRLILHQWKAWKDRQHHPTLIALPPDMLPPQDQKVSDGDD